jgi:hypothetical protein
MTDIPNILRNSELTHFWPMIKGKPITYWKVRKYLDSPLPLCSPITIEVYLPNLHRRMDGFAKYELLLFNTHNYKT